MIGRSRDWLLAFTSGILLALMLNYNGLLAKHTMPIFASWAAHGLGAFAAFVLVVSCSRLLGPPSKEAQPPPKAPLWYYLGGVPGAFTVILAAIAVNSSLALSGTIALMLVGQVLFGIVSDHFGLFRTPKRRIVAADFLAALLVLAGSVLIIFGRA
ncbi:DMT family transporter [Polyangium sp. y55x31]|uniref:DMT family transporter n=1 Tax=Polyangium sp. y55x31 TaxID=3042688 RepID=UPI002482D0D6|nr:DMT family transporter [Polyangium sp. y55x31]MDI1476294.1 DMT family transporter [Polyangium sp. y55x31]